MSWRNLDLPQIPSETPLYRISDFFSVADLIENGRLFAPSAANFEDQNEGIERLLGALEVSTGFCGGALGGFTSATRIKAFHSWFKATHYVSCWTRTMESVAMWGLYSSDMCGVQVATTAGRVGEAAKQHYLRTGADSDTLARASDGDVFITRHALVPVEYEALLKTHQRIERRGKAISKLREAGKVRELEAAEWSERDRTRERLYRVAPFTLKDQSFAHESEVRLVLRGTQASGAGLEGAKKVLATPDAQDIHLEVAIDEIEMWAEEKLLPVPESQFLTVPRNFVSEVRIDPRCPPHKRSFMESFFRKVGVLVRRSECFGYLPDSAEFRDPRYRK